MTDKPKLLPVRIQLIGGACKAGQTLCKTIRQSEAGDEQLFWLEPSGKAVGPKSSLQAIELGLVVPTGDGLFGDSQTYRAAQWFA